jgi:hypothetical protein
MHKQPAELSVHIPFIHCLNHHKPFYLRSQVSWSIRDGDHVEAGTQFGSVQGSAASILVAERIALNFLQVSTHNMYNLRKSQISMTV